MKKLIKLVVLIIISFSVYFIYQDTKNKNITIINIGDSLALGINSYGMKEYGYIDYYKDYLIKDTKVKIIKKYSEKDLSINKMLNQIQTNSIIKRDLLDTNQIIMVLGYNDLKYQISIQDNITKNKMNNIIKNIEKDYLRLIKEIRKYYKKDILVIGYYSSNKEDYYLNYGLRELNKVLKENKEITFIDIENLRQNSTKYFSNPNSYYPNQYGYKEIANRIITKTLEKKENV